MRTGEDFIFGGSPDERFVDDLFEPDGFFPGEETTEVFYNIGEPAGGRHGTEWRFEISDEEEDPSPLWAFTEEEPSERSEEIVQDWEGVVYEVDEDGQVFTARLRDLLAGETHPSRTAEIPIEDVSDDDRKLLRPGAVFYLTAGRYLCKGRQEIFGRIVFRRLPGRTPADQRRIEDRARRLIDFLEPTN